MRPDLPAGTVTFLFTDVEGSTGLLNELGAEPYAAALAEHRRLIREACARHNGVEVDTQGDAFFFAFPTGPGALAAAEEMTDALASGPIQVRVGMHTGTPILTDEGYVGGDVHRAARIAAAGHGGQVLVSSATAQLVEIELTDLGEHRFKDLSAPERVYQLGGAQFPALKSLYRTNLPVPATPFLGRERELAEVVALLESTRLLTLTGPGGTGKTRLALQAAAESADAFPDGVWWVPFAAVRDASLVLPSIAQALDVNEQPGVPLVETLQGALGTKRLLFVLDNIEHLLPTAADAISSLAVTVELQLVVTSRERLQLQVEHVYPVPTLEQSDAVTLFVSRARAVDPGAAVNGSVVDLCAALDNLPLALELAAARTALFSPQQLLERLSQRLDLLKGARDADPRQQTLRATIAWSYELLRVDEQRLLGSLSVFAGGCTYDAAEVVCGAEPDTLQSLIDKSLVRRRDSEPGPRYWMLETIREFAAETLSDAERTNVAGAHMEFYAKRLDELWRAARDREAAAWAFLRDEQANVLSALDRALALHEVDAAQKILVGAWWYWIHSGLAVEGDAWAAAVAALPSEFSVQYTNALALAGEFPRFRGDPERALPYKTRALEVVEALSADDPQAERWAAADHTDVADIYARLGDLETAARHARRGLAIRRSVGSPAGIAHALNGVGWVAELCGDLDEAVAAFTESAALSDSAGEPFESIIPLTNLGRVLSRKGEFGGAREVLDEALSRASESTHRYELAIVHNALGLLEAREGQSAVGAELLSRAAAEASDLGVAFDNLDETEAELDRCRASLAPDVYDAAVEAGRAAARIEAT